MTPMTKRLTQEQPMIGWSQEMVLDPDQDLYRLAGVIDWGSLEAGPKSPTCPILWRLAGPFRDFRG